MRLLKYTIIIIFLLVGISNATTTNYYFADDGKAGSVVGDCTNSGDPCKWFSQYEVTYDSGVTAQDCIDAWTTSDTVNLYFARGDIWTINSDAVSTIREYGIKAWDSNSDPIVNVSAFGSGNLPEFNGTVTDFSVAPAPTSSPGPKGNNNIFSFSVNGSSISYVKINQWYGIPILLTEGYTSSHAYGDNITIEYSQFTYFGAALIDVNPFQNVQGLTFQHNLVHNGGEFNLYGQWGDNEWPPIVRGSATPATSRNPANNYFGYNVLYDLGGEGILITGEGSIAEYNIIGDTSSVGIYINQHGSDPGHTIVRYNLVTMSTSNTYKNAYGPYEGISIRDEYPVGNDNSSALIEVYGNIVINRQHGLIFDVSDGGSSAFGEVRVFNNTTIDNEIKNGYIDDYNLVATGKGFWYNNASILYDKSGNLHFADIGDPANLSTYWTIDNNAYWTTGGSPTVDIDWRTNYVTTDPKLAGEEQGSPINWDGLPSGDPTSNVTIANVTPEAGSGLIDSGKTLSFEATFSIGTSDYTTLPDSITFNSVEQGADGYWDIGAIIAGTAATAPTPTDTSTSPVSCPYCSGCDVVDVVISVTTDKAAYGRISTTNQTWDQMTSGKAMTTGNGTTSLSETLSSQNCDSTVTRYVAVSTQADDNGAESSTIQIDITVNAEGTQNPPPGTTLYNDGSGKASVTIYNDSSGKAQVTPY